MKILIPLTILVLSFLIYYFLGAPTLGKDAPLDKNEVESIPLIQSKPEIKTTPKIVQESVTPQEIQKETTIQDNQERSSLSTTPITLPELVDMTGGSYEDIKVQPRTQKPGAEKDYLSLNDLRVAKKEHDQREPKTFDYNEEVFKQLKIILEKSSSTYYAKKHIVLNSSISSLLYTKKAKERFVVLVADAFGLDQSMVQEQYANHLIVWDWVRYLSP